MVINNVSKINKVLNMTVFVLNPQNYRKQAIPTEHDPKKSK